MYFSKYIKQFSFSEYPDHFLLYSTKKTSTILIPKSVFRSAESGAISSASQKILFDLGFLVNNSEEEKREMLAFFDEINKRNRQFNATVILNLDCNFNCIYCFEGGMKGSFYMSGETASYLVDFIEKNYIGRADNLKITFYGGEPMLSVDLIKYISDRIKTSAEEIGSEYTFGLVTNGTLLTKKTAEEMIKFGLRSCRISLDGPMNIHNRFRPFATGSGTFDVIVRNIKDICDLIEVHVTGAFTQDNYKEFPKLIDYLIDEGLTPEKIASVKFDPVMKSPFNCSEFRDGCSSINEPWLVDAGIFLREEILKSGFSTPKVQPATCIVELENSIAINYDGGILKCPAFMGYGLEAGNIFTGISDFKESHRRDVWKRLECLECEYLPICFGGCRYLKLLQNGEIDGVDCKRAYLDAAIETLVKQDLKYSRKIAP